ncbi:hypothetical protein [Citrobacter phage Tr1]|nr:hypothetical protein [Citrobacter phage Tr1]
MSIYTIKDLLDKGDFLVHTRNRRGDSEQVCNMLADLINAGYSIKVDEAMRETSLEHLSPQNLYSCPWEFVGISDSETYMTDGEFADYEDTYIILRMHEFNDIYIAAIAAASAEDETVNLEINASAPEDLVDVLNGPVVLTYKGGKQFHLRENGVATLNLVAGTITTEHDFLKDGQPALERVVVDIDFLESVAVENKRFDFLDDRRVAITHFYTR